MKKFSYFEHTADVLFEAYGKTLEECIENAAAAMFTVMAKPRLLSKGRKAVVKAKAPSLEELVVFTLDRLVGESDAMQVFWKEFKVLKLASKAAGKGSRGSFALEGVAFGSAYSRKAAGTHVKAVTMHRASVFKQKNGNWVARIVLDI